MLFRSGIEVKPGDKKQSEEQVKFEGDLTRAGGFYRVIRNVDELSDFVDFVRYGKHLTNV